MMLLNPYRFAGVASGDPYWASVTALLPLDGSDGATAATDEKGGTVTFIDTGPVISTAQSLAGGSSLYLPGTGHVTVGSPNADLGSGDFTVELFAYHASLSSTWRTLLSIPLDIGRMTITTRSGLVQYNYGNISGNNYATIPLNAWVHIALVRQGTTLSVYVGGARVAQFFDAVQRTVAGPLNLGRDSSAVFTPYIGYLDAVRISKFARYYGATISVPTTPLPTITHATLTPPAVGELWTGQGGYYAGIANYADGRRFHLVLADKAADLAKTWGYYNVTTGATNGWDGLANQGVIEGLGLGSSAAFTHTAGYAADGKTDFYLPSSQEMKAIRDALYPAKAGQHANFATGGTQALVDDSYTTSTEYNQYIMYVVRISDGPIMTSSAKDAARRARPVRRIPV